MRMLLAAVTLVACSDKGSVRVFHGPLTAASVATTDIDPDRYEVAVVAAGDVDGDGRCDFFVTSDEATDLYFGAHAHADASVSAHDGLVALGDVTGDGRADFVVTMDETELFFAGGPSPSDLDGTVIPDADAIGAIDIDGDGITDLVAVDQLGLDVYRGGSAFDLSAPDHMLLTQPAGASTVALQSAGDIDGDGREDVAMQWTGEPLGVYRGGVALASAPAATLATGRLPAIGKDFDGDGFGDLAVSAYDHTGMPQVLVYFGPKLDAPRFALPGILGDAGDVDGDGYPDLIVLSQTGDADIYLGGPAMDDAADIVLPHPDGEGFSSAAYLGDIDGDGTADVVAAYPGFLAE